MGLLAGLFVRIVVGVISLAIQIAFMLGALLGQLLVAILPYLARAVGALCRALFQLLTLVAYAISQGLKSGRPMSPDDEWTREGHAGEENAPAPPANRTRTKRVAKSYW